jgi:GETHR pentapeptide repeat (5 copies)
MSQSRRHRHEHDVLPRLWRARRDHRALHPAQHRRPRRSRRGVLRPRPSLPDGRGPAPRGSFPPARPETARPETARSETVCPETVCPETACGLFARARPHPIRS